MTEPADQNHDHDGEAVDGEAVDGEAVSGAAESAAKSSEEQLAETQARAQTFDGEHVVAAPLAEIALVHLPTVTAGTAPDDARARLATQNSGARTQSVEQLGVWFPGYDFEAAAQTSDDRRFHVLTIGAELHNHLNALDVVESLLAEHELGAHLRFAHGEIKGQQPDRVIDPMFPQTRRALVGGVVDAIDQNWTTVLNNIDRLDPTVAGVCEHLERVYGSPVNTNVYISHGPALGFGPHWDSHDTIIVPATGTKHWTVYEPLALSPERPWVGPDVSPRPVWEGAIEPGMCLVIPRGWGHEVGGSDDLAIHYTIGINRMTVRHLVGRLVTEGGFNPLIRADVAFDPNEPVHSYERSVHDEADSLTALFDDVMTPEFTERAIAAFRAQLPLRIFPRLFDAWIGAGIGDWTDMTLRMPVPAGIQIISVQPGAITVAFGMRQISLTPAAFEIIVALGDCRHHPFAELPSGDDPEIRAGVCRELVRAGLVDVRFSG